MKLGRSGSENSLWGGGYDQNTLYGIHKELI